MWKQILLAAGAARATSPDPVYSVNVAAAETDSNPGPAFVSYSIELSSFPDFAGAFPQPNLLVARAANAASQVTSRSPTPLPTICSPTWATTSATSRTSASAATRRISRSTTPPSRRRSTAPLTRTAPTTTRRPSTSGRPFSSRIRRCRASNSRTASTLARR